MDIAKEKEKYFIGLDIGSDSVGYAVTDENYNIIKINNVLANGVRIVDPSQSKANRRVFRSNRRRMERKKYRLALLRQLFQDEILKTDPSFFKRLEESFFVEEDKMVEGKYSLFFDKDFTDKHYHKKFPTIYHLKQYLINTNEKPDLRLVYLAVHHYIKYRGHFLLSGDDIDIKNGLMQLFENLNEVLKTIKENNEDLDIEYFDLSRVNELDNIFASSDYKKDKKQKTKEILNAKTKHLEKLIDAFYGSSVKLSDLFFNESYDDNTVSKVEFSKSTFDDQDMPVLEDELEENIDLILALKAIYNYILLKQILGDYNLLTDAMVSKFNKHEYDLKILKNYFKTYLTNYDYFLMFKGTKETDKNLFSDEKNNKSDLSKLDRNYSAYIGMAKVKKQKVAIKKCKKEDFYKLVKEFVYSSYNCEDKNLQKAIEIVNGEIKKLIEAKILNSFYKKLNLTEIQHVFENVKDRVKEIGLEVYNEIFNNLEKFETTRYIFTQIEIDNFLPKQTTQDNTVIPYQINKNELQLLLNNVGRFYEFLNDDTKDKIIQLLKFRVPYYVGPLHTADEKNVYSWVVRKSFEKITPWNFEEVIDLESSNEEFIAKLINYCTYLHSEKVIPKQSLLYSKFMIYNELNKLRINNQEISVELKNRIFENVFKQNKTVSFKLLKKWLIDEQIFSKDEEIKFSGLSDESKFNSNYSSYITLKKVLGDFVDNNVKETEEIIEFITIYGTNKKLLEKKLRENFKDLSQSQIKQLLNINFTGWSSLSRKLLTGLKATDRTTGEMVTIMDVLRETNQNLMEIINNKDYNFKELIENENPIKDEKLSYDIVDELYISPLIKRVVWQAIKIVDEIVKLKGYKPAKIFVEVTRTNSAKKQRTVSRKKKLLDAYKELKKVIDKEYYDELIKELEAQTDESLRKEEVYLYFLQQGKSAYSDKKLYLNELNRTCDIDHIIPQWLIKDDSLDNKVLVYKDENQKLKGERYPVPEEIQNKMKGFWQYLNSLKFKEFKFLSDEKLRRLTRTTELSDNELTGFINRQLVQTNQATTSIINILKRFFVENDTDVVYSKAENVTDFRAKFELTKIREVNDFHHAKDAYLNIVVGNTLNVKFGNDIKKYIIENKYKMQPNKQHGYNLIKVFENDVYDNKTGKKVWSTTESESEKDSKDIVEYNYYLTDVIVTHTSFSGSGEFHNIGLVKKAKGLIPIKTKDERLLNTARYGGYKSMKNESFFVLKTTDNEGKEQIIIETMPILYSKKIQLGQLTFDQYVKDILGYSSYEIIKKDIKPYSTILFDGVEYYIAASSGIYYKFVCAEQLKMNKDCVKKLKPIVVYNKLNPNNDVNIKMPKALQEKISHDSLNELYEFLTKKLGNKPYCNIATFYNNILPLLTNNKLNFTMDTLENKCYLIGQLINLLHRNTSGADLRLVGGKKQSGVIWQNKNITEHEVYLVNYSCAGFRKNLIKLS